MVQGIDGVLGEALKREHPALQNIKFLNFFLPLWVIFALIDPDPKDWFYATAFAGGEGLAF
jgi:hypothetical protein